MARHGVRFTYPVFLKSGMAPYVDSWLAPGAKAHMMNYRKDYLVRTRRQTMRSVFWVVVCAIMALSGVPQPWLPIRRRSRTPSPPRTAMMPPSTRSWTPTSSPGFEVVQVNLPVLSHYSYILVSGKEALIVDPDRDVQFYLDYASKNGLTIKGVYLTHSHADFVAGHLEIVKAADCPIYQSASSGAGYKIEPMKDGSTFKIGSAVVKVLETPGHTPDGTCGLVYAGEEDKVGKVLFTGDTLFVGSVGRPDLLEGKMTAASLASMGFRHLDQQALQAG